MEALKHSAGIWAGLFLLLLLSSCQPSRFLGEKELLYKGADLETIGPAGLQPTKALQSELLASVRPYPNTRIFGQYFRLWVYQKMKRDKERKGLGAWLQNKVGEAPVLYDEQVAERNRRRMELELRNQGFLNGKVTCDTLHDKKTVKLKYTLQGKGQFVIASYDLPPDTTSLLKTIREADKKATIKSGIPYRLDLMEAERERILRLAYDAGFYDFRRSYVYFYLDTTSLVDRFMKIHLRLKSPADQADYQPHILGNVNIFPDYKSQQDTTPLDTIREGQWTMIQHREIVKLSALQEAISQDSGMIYIQKQEAQTINYLIDLGIFKFVNLQYEKDSVAGQTILNRYFYLTPNLNQDFAFDWEASTRRSNSLGSAVGINYNHRNLFRGAEALKIGLNLGIETQWIPDAPLVSVFEGSLNFSLRVPRLYLPFHIGTRLKSAIPQTHFQLTTKYLRENRFFTSASALLEMGYRWKKSRGLQYEFYPLQFTLLRLFNRTELFDQLLLENPRLAQNYTNLSIVAANFRLTYSNQLRDQKKDFGYTRFEIEPSGNLANAIVGLTNTTQDPRRLLGSPLAQYLRLEGEGRYTMYQRKSSLVGRLLWGVAIPYGNSTAVPYIRQFFVGGANSLRAFQFRGVGPGTFQQAATSEATNAFTLDRVGDLKLEMNLEYRFPLVSYLRAAFFVDAGNVWLVGEAAKSFPEGRFRPNTFYRQLALGTGVGLRLDIQYVVVRFDLGIPLHNPGLEAGSTWIISTFPNTPGQWWQEQVRYNLAIGYPF